MITVADAGSGLRAGQALPCLRSPAGATSSTSSATWRSSAAIWRIVPTVLLRTRSDASGSLTVPSGMMGGGAKSVKTPLGSCAKPRCQADAAVALSDDAAPSIGWLRHDVLAVAGPCSADRRLLYDFVVAELKNRASRCPHRLGPVCRQLENQRDDLLAFARALDADLELLGRSRFPQNCFDNSSASWHATSATRGAGLRNRPSASDFAVGFTRSRRRWPAAAKGTVRASSLVENLNSRLRSYFFLRRHLGEDYLALLQFFLNHRRLERSDRPERVGKTPAELLTGQSHPHWLEMLGYTRFVAP